MTDPAAAQQALSGWIDDHLFEILDAGAFSLPVVCDFVLVVAAEDAADGPARGVTRIGVACSANAVYRTRGLLETAIDIVCDSAEVDE